MRVPVLVLALVAVLVAGCDEEPKQVSGPSRESTGDPATAARYAPLVFLADGEKNLPMDATRYIEKASLWFLHGDDCDDHEVAGRVDAARLNEKAADGYAHEQDDCAGNGTKDVKVTEPAAEGTGFFLKAGQGTRPGDGPGAPVYWEFHKDDKTSQVAYVYWFFYGYNDLDRGNKHEGDWERVAVPMKDGKPDGVVFYKHGGLPCKVPWEGKLGKSGDHPHVYAAKGSHGSYPDSGNTYIVPASVDSRSAGTQWNTWENARALPRQPWWGYRGWWGKESWVPVPGFDRIPGPGPNRVINNVFIAKSCDDAEEPVATELSADFEGEWETEKPATQRPRVTPYHIRLSLGRQQSTVHYRTTWDQPDPKLDCAGTWTVTGSTRHLAAMHEKIESTKAGRCVPEGNLSLELVDGKLRVTYTGDNVAMAATLVKRAKTDAPPGTSPRAASGNTTEAALARFEEYLHAVGNENLDVVCDIAGPGAKKAEQEGFGPCRKTMPVMFRMISATQKQALRTATVDTKQVTAKPGEVKVPAKAIKAGTVKFTSSDLGDRTITFQNGQWYVTD
ncbi:hypothetical protein [Kibdelosporangium phytohabitans]|uniref:DUF946 domain-containing protein n=1 Tax=Kibdelosporangium phytohabitans TaxID=860235 RepID=A0A0N9I5D5_9PSEU|nr:hypothetical protein [Kibdelosporangium phytohabitans]ALG09883.1 hypothetical protein AOZ06_25960 [Kibdelosporangium phytohabitans]MBE1468716.1 hypothetical protein [Kibdelosporangium phytohabitans]